MGHSHQGAPPKALPEIDIANKLPFVETTVHENHENTILPPSMICKQKHNKVVQEGQKAFHRLLGNRVVHLAHTIHSAKIKRCQARVYMW